MSEEFRRTRGSERRILLEPGQRFGQLVVLTEQRKDGQWWAQCQCDCGSLAEATVCNLSGGQVQSCGCLQSKRAAETNAERATHGLSSHEHYSRWHKMLRRCEEPKDPRYPEWGGRGISVCAEWHDPAVFVAYLETVLGPRPAGYSLDRIDNDGNYEPGNVRWASVLTQRHNQRRAKRKP